MDTVYYHPKGSMCASCDHKDRDCDHLPFNRMPVIDEYRRDIDTAVIRTVACTEHSREGTPTVKAKQAIPIPVGKTRVVTEAGDVCYVDGYVVKEGRAYGVLVELHRGLVRLIAIGYFKAEAE